MLPKYLTQPSKSPQKKGLDYEIKAKNVIASGRFFSKGDIEVETSDEQYVVDTKLVIKQKSYTFSLAQIDKFYKQITPKTPVYIIKLGGYRLKVLVEKE